MRKILTLCTAVAVLLLTSACSKPSAGNPNNSQPVAQAAQTVEVFGTVQSTRVRKIVLDTPATVSKVLVKEGQRVKKGDALVELEPNENQVAEKSKKSYLSGNMIISDEDDTVVSNIGYVSGERAGPAKPVLTLSGTRDLIVQANVLEEFIRDVKVGAKVTIIPTADKSRKYTGKVNTVGSSAFRQNGETTIPVEISIDGSDDFLMIGFSAQVIIDK